MKIAGVSVNIKSLPLEEDIIKHALNTKEYIYKKDAIKLIKAEIKSSGLYKRNRAKSTKQKTKLREDNRQNSNTEKEAVEQIRELEYGAIFHEQGLGKTKIAIDVMLYWLQKKLVDSVVIVVKKNLIANWQEELKLHTM